MGRTEKRGKELIYKQDDGKITANLTNFVEDKMILDHEPTPGYRRIFHTIVLISVLYFIVIFLFFNGGF
jgi:hypothetical protein